MNDNTSRTPTRWPIRIVGVAIGSAIALASTWVLDSFLIFDNTAIIAFRLAQCIGLAIAVGSAAGSVKLAFLLAIAIPAAIVGFISLLFFLAGLAQAIG